MTTDQTIDREALEQLLETVGGDQGFLAELVETFLSEAPSMLSEVQAALQAGDADRLRLSAHSLKSNAAQFGASRLQALCLQIEQRAKEHNLDGLEQLAAQAEAEFQIVRSALQ